MKTYEIQLNSGKAVTLRLTSRALSNYIKEHGLPGAAPLVSVMNAVNDMDALIALLTAAMRYPGSVVDKELATGAELLDALADEDKGDVYIKGLVVQLARDAGLVNDQGAKELADAAGANSAQLVSKIAALLRLDGVEEEAQEEENPT